MQRKEQSKTARSEKSTGKSNFLSSIKGGAIQAKVKVGPANDKFELEADQMADKAMRMAEPSVQTKQKDLSTLVVNSGGDLQRKDTEIEESETDIVQAKEWSHTSVGENPVQPKEIAADKPDKEFLQRKIKRIPESRSCISSKIIQRKEEEEVLQEKSDGINGRAPPVGSGFASKLNQSKGSGQPMDNSTNSFMSSRFGADFGGVRIHTGGNAQNMSESINAKAFTHRNDIYFNKGQYQPETSAGKTLLAHELTHTIQQGGVGASVQTKLKLGSPDDKYEREADTMADKVMRKPMTSVQRKCASCEDETIQRFSKKQSRGPPEIQCKPWEKKDTSEEVPIQRKKQTNPVRGPDTTGGIIQRNILDDVGGAISDAADFVGDSLGAGIDWIKEELNDLAEDVTGFELLTVVLAKNPITGRDVTRNGRNFIDAGLEVIPNGEDYKRKMQADGGYEDAIAWIDEQMALLDFTVWDVLEDFGDFIGDLGLSDIRSPGAALRRGLRVFGHYIDRLFTFAVNVATKLLEIVKELAINALLEWIREETPWYPLLTVVLEEDPITGEPVERTGMNILTGFIMLHPDGEAQLAQMEESGSLERAATWVDEAIIRVTRIAEGLVNGFTTAWEDFTITDLLTPIDTFNEIYELFSTPVSELIDFAIEVALMILQFIKDALIARLIEYARTIPGYSLITVMLGKDIFSEERVDRTPKNIIKGFMELVPGGAEKFQELDQTGAIDDAVSWIEGAIEELDLTWEAVVTIFTTAWNEFSLADLATPIETFGRVMDLFAAPVYRVIRFVGKVVFKLVEIALRIMGFPFELIGSIIERAQTAYEEIKRDPIQFLKNVLRAVKQGFIQFFDNILTHLLNGVGEWLFGQLGDAGITIPEDFSFQSILKLVFEILGVTREKIFEKIREKVGPERWAQIEGAIDTLTGIWTFVNDVLTRGPIAIWEKIQEQLSGLWDMVISAARNWIITKIIQQVTVKLLSFLDPTGIMAVVNSFIAFFNAVQSAIQYMIPMLEMLNSFLGGVIQIAQGNIQPAADLLERTMAQGMPILIGFLANQVGLGSIGRKIGEVIESLQEKVDEGIQWLIDRAWEIGARLLEMGRNAVGALTEWWNSRRSFDSDGENHSLFFRGGESNARLMVASTPTTIEEWLRTRETELQSAGEFSGAKSTAHGRIRNQWIPEMESITNSNAGPGSTTAARSIDAIMQDITSDIQVVGMGSVAEPPVPPMVVSPGFSDSQATSGTAQFTYDGPGNHQDGSGTSNSNLSDEFTELANLGLGGGFWVRFHLINEDLGGRAVDSNLVPLPQQLNRQYSAEFEEPLKALYRGVPADPEKPKKPVWYNIRLIYWGSDPRWLRSINVRGGKMKPSGNTWVNDRGISPWSRSNIPKPGSGSGESINSFIGSSSPDFSQVARDTGLFNRTVRLLHSRGSPISALNDIETIVNAQTSSEWTDDRKARHISKFQQVRDAGRIQLKAKVENVNDPLEQEADRMANRVVQMKSEDIQRVCKKCNDEEVLQRTLSGESGGSTVSRGFQEQLISSRGGGSPMDADTRSFMESRFESDFSNVSIHTGQKASALNDQIGARAFTTGSDIYFNQGEYNPGTTEGKRLLAHELTHTIQQEGDGELIQRTPWGICIPKGPRADARNWMINQAAELKMLAHAKARLSGSIISNKELAGDMLLTSLPPTEQRRYNKLKEGFYRSKRRRRSVKPVDETITDRPEADGAAQRSALEWIAALFEPDIIDLTTPAIYDVTTDKQAAQKTAKFKSIYLPRLKLATGETWQLGTVLPKPLNINFLMSPKYTVCYGPTDFGAHPGVIQYSAYYNKKSDKDKDDEKKKKKEEEKKRKEEEKKRKKEEKERKRKEREEKKKKKAAEKKKRKEAKKKPKKKKPSKTTKKPKKPKAPKAPKSPKVPKPPKPGVPAGPNFGIGIGLPGAGAGNVGVGINLGTSAGVGNAGVGVNLGSETIGAGNVGVGATVGSQSAGVGTAGAGLSEGDTTAAAGAAGVGTSSGNTVVVAGAAGAGKSENNTAAAAGVSGTGETKDEKTATAGNGEKEGGKNSGEKTEGKGGEKGDGEGETVKIELTEAETKVYKLLVAEKGHQVTPEAMLLLQEFVDEDITDEQLADLKKRIDLSKGESKSAEETVNAAINHMIDIRLGIPFKKEVAPEKKKEIDFKRAGEKNKVWQKTLGWKSELFVNTNLPVDGKEFIDFIIPIQKIVGIQPDGVAGPLTVVRYYQYMKKPHDDVYAKALKFLSEEDKKAKIPENIKTDDSDALKNPLDILVPGSFFKMDKETGRLSVRDFVKEFKEKGVTLNKVYFRIDPSTKIEVKDKTYQFGDQKPISLQHVKFYVKAIVDTVPEKSEYFPDDEFIKSKKWVWSPVERKSKEIVYSKVRKSLMKLVTLENGKAKLLKKGENAHLTEIMATIHDMNNVTVTKDGISGTITITPTQLFDPKANTIMSGNRVYYFKVGKRVSLKFFKER